MNEGFLIDTNVWLESLMAGERSDELRLFFATVPAEEIFISDLTLHVLARVLKSKENMQAFVLLVNDLFIKNNVNRISLEYMDYTELAELTAESDIDYDDAYHYLLAKSRNLTWISLNPDLEFEEVELRTPTRALIDLKEGK